MLRAGRPVVPAKITSSISPPRRPRALVSPIAHRRASTILDLPQPFGPTIPVSPGRISTPVGSAKLLNPVIRSLLKLTGKQPSHDLPYASGISLRNASKSISPAYFVPLITKLGVHSLFHLS